MRKPMMLWPLLASVASAARAEGMLRAAWHSANPQGLLCRKVRVLTQAKFNKEYEFQEARGGGGPSPRRLRLT
jgi:hypothetical protein